MFLTPILPGRFPSIQTIFLRFSHLIYVYPTTQDYMRKVFAGIASPMALACTLSASS